MYKHFELDVCDEKQVIDMFNNIRRGDHKLFCVINNAGVASMNHILTTPKSTFQKLTDVNFIGTALCSREGVKLMLRQRTGRIINFSTVASPLNLSGEAVYAASKAAVETFSRTLSDEVSKYNITVNIIGPSPAKTDLISGVPNDKIMNLLQKLKVKRLCNYDDIVNVVDFFIDEKSSMVTGQTIYLGGVS
jgi:3-oxoacyl-[acyl-carrier protein] reductase